MKRFAVLIFAATIVAGAVLADPSAKKACLGPEHDHDPGAIIAACTSMLETGNLTARDRAKAFSRRGTAYYAKEDYDRAIADFDQAIKLNPKDGETSATRGFSYSMKNQNDQAIADFSMAIKLDPKDENTIAARGLVYTFVGQYDRAIADFDRAIKLKPDDAQALYERGLAKGHLGDTAGANEDKAKALAIDPKIEDELNEE